MKDRVIYLAGGCFWGVEGYFKRIKGVIDTSVGYANGVTVNPDYESVCTGNTGYAETVKVIYDEDVVSLYDILRRYFVIIDPESLNRQGNDRGTQYRTGIYYVDKEDKEAVEGFLDEQRKVYKNLAVESGELKKYYLAEEYHQNYLNKNKGGYCHIDLGLANKDL